MRVFTLRDKRSLSRAAAAAATAQTGIPVANLFGLVISAHSDFRIYSLPTYNPHSWPCGGDVSAGFVVLWKGKVSYLCDIRVELVSRFQSMLVKLSAFKSNCNLSENGSISRAAAWYPFLVTQQTSHQLFQTRYRRGLGSFPQQQLYHVPVPILGRIPQRRPFILIARV